MGRTVRAILVIIAASLAMLFARAADGASSDPVVLYTVRPAEVAGIATPVLPLNGVWSFHPAPPKGFEKLTEKSADGFKPIEVPGDWTMQGFTVKPWTAAAYMKTVTIPADWKGARIILRSDGAQSLASFWVNGEPAGTHEGGFTAFEFDVTGLCRPGAVNTIAAAVQNESTADILASGTQYASYQFGGLTRKVTLFALPALHIADIDVSTDVAEDGRSAVFKIDVLVAASSAAVEAEAALDLAVAGPDGHTVLRRTLAVPRLGRGDRKRLSFEGVADGSALWESEHPRLHTIALELRAGGRSLEKVVRRVGLREIEVAGTRLFVNGRAVKLRGVNRHEVHPLRGRSLTPELWRKDAELFRAANMNYIRTSHYPPAEEFLDACDELGLFVECEAPLVWVQHGANETWKTEDPADPKYLPYIERAVAETIAFNRLHPSIIYWSLANESGWSAHFAAAAAIARAMDPTRPQTFHDQAYGGYNNRGSEAVPIANYHYPGPQGPDLAVSLRLPRPLLYGEYCHLNCYNRAELADDPGLRDEYGRGFARMWEKVFGSAEVIGGAIWSGLDDVFLLPSGRATGYGEWGPIDGWRREKPEYWHIKKSYSPVRIGPDRLAAPKPGEPIVLGVENRHDFTDLGECRLDWRIGGEMGSSAIALAPRSSGILRVRPKTPDLAGKVLRIDVTGPRGFLIDSTEISIGEIQAPAAPFRPLVAEAGPVELKEDATRITVRGKDFRWVIDRKTGAIVEGMAGGVPVISGGPALMLLPQTSGACTTDFRLDVEPLNDVCKNWAVETVSTAQDADGVTVSVKGSYAEAGGWYAVRIDGAGRAEFSYEFKVRSRTNPRQVGLVVYLPRSFDTLSWRRRGQWTVYPENHIGRTVGTAKALSPEHAAVFRRPPAWDWKDDQNALGSNDFRSTKANVLWAVLAGPSGEGLMLASDGRQAARAFLDGDRVGWLIADFSTGGGDIFFAPHHKMDDRPLEAGDTVAGKIALSFVRASR
ncbi:MAG TPA: glycoside hydrolase family 2 TIM barrel-domain containing protein [Acidobacteriota bacterium]|nr:glycoside hydrolase family 2 TIM barrel-domain containing protein [Acidobacteriota bacterium]